jgi:NUMOD1 domain
MNYLKHYNMLMERSQNRVIEGYVEKHHIIPRCLGGTNDVSNIAVLTPEEHFLAHQLLVKIYPNCAPLVNAAVIMTTHHTEYRANNKLFGWLRRKASTYRKEWLKENGHPKGFLGKNHKLEDINKITAGIRQTAVEKRIPIYAYNLDGTLYKKYESLIECAEDLKTNPSNVKYTAEGKFTHCKGKQIRYDYVESMPPRTSRLAGVKKYNYVCPHCNKEGRGPAMKRFHFDRCKMKRKTI